MAKGKLREAEIIVEAPVEPVEATKKRRKTRRRGNGEGSIFQRKHGLWGGTITVGYDANGKRKRRTVYGKTKREVQDKLTKLQGQRLDGTLMEPCKMTVAQYLTHWLDDVIKPSVRWMTYRDYERLIRLHIVPGIGGVKLTKLSPPQLQGLYGALDGRGVGSRTRQGVHDLLHTAFDQAVKWGMIPRNPCSVVERPRHRRRRMNTWTAQETKDFLKEAKKDRLYALYVLAITTGMRQGELLGLQWDDVDLPNATISVTHNLVHAEGGGFELADPKTSSGRRLIALPNLAVAALDDHRKQLLAEGRAGSQWVFCDSNGGHMRRDNFADRNFRPLLKRSGVRPIRFHDLRHTCATLLLLQGEHPKVVQERLGHSSISITLDTYSHVLPSMQKQASRKLDRLLA